MPEEKIFKVSEFNEFISTYLSTVGEVIVEGEISEIKVSQSRWLFLAIKDEKSSVEVFSLVFRIKNYDVLEEGMLVHIYGTPHLYQKTARFSIFASQIIPAGEGALRIAFEKLKLKLEREGLFDEARKRPLPAFPERIGLITAKNSHAYSDFIKVLSERMGGIKIYFYPVQVQGRDAVPSILAAFAYFNKNLPDLDLLVLTRGGGSLEDLLSFNDEEVTRAIFSSKIPVVCGVGHEEDVSLADLVADLRASTPSNSAELIVRNKEEVLRQVYSSVSLMDFRLTQLLKEKRQQIFLAVSRLKTGASQRIKDLHFLLSRFIKEFSLFGQKLERIFVDVDICKNQLIKAVDFWDQQNIIKFESLIRLLRSLDYRRVLERSFSITMDKNGRILKRIKGVKINDGIASLLFNGKIYSRVLKTEIKR